MTNMYNVNIDEIHDITIDGNLFICESVSPTESFPRRELNRTKIIGGTEIATKGQYIGRDISITTHVAIDPLRPDMYDADFQEMMSKICEVISPELGGKFNAQVIIKKEHDKPKQLKLTIQIIEVADAVSKIPGEGKFIIPEDKLESEEDKLARESKNKNKTDGPIETEADKEKLVDLKQKVKEFMDKRGR